MPTSEVMFELPSLEEATAETAPLVDDAVAATEEIVDEEQAVPEVEAVPDSAPEEFVRVAESESPVAEFVADEAMVENIAPPSQSCEPTALAAGLGSEKHNLPGTADSAVGSGSHEASEEKPVAASVSDSPEFVEPAAQPSAKVEVPDLSEELRAVSVTEYRPAPVQLPPIDAKPSIDVEDSEIADTVDQSEAVAEIPEISDELRAVSVISKPTGPKPPQPQTPSVESAEAAAPITVPNAKLHETAKPQTPKAVEESTPAVVAPVSTPAKPAPAPVHAAKVVEAMAPEIVVEPSADGKILFRSLNLLPEVQRAVEKSGYDTPTDIQAEIIPHMLEGRDVLAQSQTGTGKTAAFALPILCRVDVKRRLPQVLVLAPTRELAIQVAKSFQTYAEFLPGFSVAAIYGGQDYGTQLQQLRRGVQVVVGTPGRVIDHIKRGSLDLSGIECLALDEADEMLNMGFLEDVQFVLDQTPEERQVALFSATLPGPIRKIAQTYLKDPVRITIQRRTMTADSIRQRAIFVSPRDKVDVLTRFLEVEETDGVIVFTKTKDATVNVAEELVARGLSAIALNRDMAQRVRERTNEQLKAGHLDILVATDVAARGLDVTRVSHVFNFDVPHDSESYVHRIGRTGRAGRKGEAIIFLTNSQRYKLKTIERATKQEIQVVQPPTAEDMNAMRITKFRNQISETIDKANLELFTKLVGEYAEESGKSMLEIAAALAHLKQGDRPFFSEDRPRRKPMRNDDHGDNRGGDRFGRGQRDRNSGPGGGGRDEPRQLGAPRPGMDRYRIEVGRKDGVKPGNIVGAVANEGGINGDQIGPISIHQAHSTVDLPTGMPNDVFQTLRATRVAGKPLNLRRDFGGGGGQSEGGGGGGGRSFTKRRHERKPDNGGKFRKRKPRSN